MMIVLIMILEQERAFATDPRTHKESTMMKKNNNNMFDTDVHNDDGNKAADNTIVNDFLSQSFEEDLSSSSVSHGGRRPRRPRRLDGKSIVGMNSLINLDGNDDVIDLQLMMHGTGDLGSMIIDDMGEEVGGFPTFMNEHHHGRELGTTTGQATCEVEGCRDACSHCPSSRCPSAGCTWKKVTTTTEGDNCPDFPCREGGGCEEFCPEGWVANHGCFNGAHSRCSCSGKWYCTGETDGNSESCRYK